MSKENVKIQPAVINLLGEKKFKVVGITKTHLTLDSLKNPRTIKLKIVSSKLQLSVSAENVMIKDPEEIKKGGMITFTAKGLGTFSPEVEKISDRSGTKNNTPAKPFSGKNPV